MHRSRLGTLVIDCRTDDLAGAARFWARALGYAVSDHNPDPRYIALLGPAREVTALVQQVEHEPRVHLDVETDDQEAEVARLQAAGAKRVDALKGWIVMEAPTGHRFCVVKPQRPDLAEHGNAWDADGAPPGG